MKLRKAKILKANSELIERLEIQNSYIKKLQNEKEELLKEISLLKEENEELKAQIQKSKPLLELEEKIIGNANINDETKYGASAIGKIVVSATKNCNLLANENFANAKELVNLILGRTEVAKAEILKIVSLESDFESKKALIDNEITSAEDYFLSVRGQV